MSIATADRDELALQADDDRPDFMLGCALELAGIGAADYVLRDAILRATEASATRKLTLVKLAAREMRASAERVAALARALDIKLAAELNRNPKVRT